MLSKKAITSEIIKMLQKHYPTERITIDTLLEGYYGDDRSISNLNMSSLDLVEFISDIEEYYNIIIDFDAQFYTVKDVIENVCHCIEQKKGN
ncbi:MAG TPA: hypothetical protein DEP00_08045 [Lachnospiraceae bacterium]|nr:hypothetical protein [Lachnospiraceae bacterium]